MPANMGPTITCNSPKGDRVSIVESDESVRLVGVKEEKGFEWRIWDNGGG